MAVNQAKIFEYLGQFVKKPGQYDRKYSGEA